MAPRTFRPLIILFPLSSPMVTTKGVQVLLQDNGSRQSICLINKLRNCSPCLGLFAGDMQSSIGRGQKSGGVTYRHADSDLSHIQCYQSRHVSLPESLHNVYSILTKEK